MDLDQLCVNTIRILSADMVEKAKSGHPGMPLGAAPMAYALWSRHLRHNPKNTKWFNRDRFILSAGHGSAMLYSLLYLTGYDLNLEDLMNFRQWGSKTPGHPEYGLTPGVEATTGPLGQGFGMGVGMAMAECYLASKYNRPGFEIVDHYTYAIVSDGDLEEGISSEAAALAGRQKLGKLIYLYDSNHISIEGDTRLAWTEDVKLRFEAHGWQVIEVEDGNNIDTIDAAIKVAKDNKEQPSLIIVRTHIGYGSPKQDSEKSHGEPLGEEALKATKRFFGFPEDKMFYVPEEALNHCRKAVEKGQKLEEEWKKMFEAYEKEFPVLAKEFKDMLAGFPPEGWDSDIPTFKPEDGPMATRSASGKVMNAIAPHIPTFLGGSADLAPSNKTYLNGFGDFDCSQKEKGEVGRNIHFGIREHAMGAAVNGMALHSGLFPYGATFLVFSDYMRASVRLAALMKTNSTFIYTHDSIAVGEDGPTHQPVEQVMSLRLIPDLVVIRPADANETAEAWKIAIKQKRPIALIFTRQNVPVLDPEKYPIKGNVEKGAYVLSDSKRTPDIILIGTGSEVHLALSAKEELEKEGINVRVVSMPSWELFDEQGAQYQDSVILEDVPKLAIEAGTSVGWEKYVGRNGAVIGVDRFGASAPGNVVLEKYGFTVENVIKKAKKLLNK